MATGRVRFDDNVKVREHFSITPSMTVVDGQNIEDVGTYKRTLGWNVASEYVTALKDVNYTPEPPVENSEDARRAAQQSLNHISVAQGKQPQRTPQIPSRDISTHNHLSSPPPKMIHNTNDQGQNTFFSPSGAQPPVHNGHRTNAPNNANNTKSAPRLIDGWHIKPDGFLYQGPTEHSSQVVEVHGNIVVTRSGSRYALGTLDDAIAKVMRLIAGNNAGAHAFNPHDPLAAATRAQLLFAERIVYGPARESGRQVLEALDRLQADLGFPNMVSEHFEAMRSILRTLAICPDTVGMTGSPNKTASNPSATPSPAANNTSPQEPPNEQYKILSPPPTLHHKPNFASGAK